MINEHTLDNEDISSELYALSKKLSVVSDHLMQHLHNDIPTDVIKGWCCILDDVVNELGPLNKALYKSKEKASNRATGGR